MKNSFDQSADESSRNEVCSENTCATCFENRGCIYEHYMSVTMSKTEESYPAIRIDGSAPVREKVT